MKWENVYVFLSSTFNDMHAERDYLLKDVFPALSEWCEMHSLRLIDIDLRWGVTEADANENRNTVKICMERIDECRPFFLCFLGQRRGWVPANNDISVDTLEEYPELANRVGKESVTEMEILHALYSPMHKNGAPMKAVEHALFFLRGPDYLKDIPRELPQLYETYTNDGIPDEAGRAAADAALQGWRSRVDGDTQAKSFHYTAQWNSEEKTPELMLPLAPDSDDEEDVASWEKLWRGVDIPKEEYNRKISAGRLTSFRSGQEELSVLVERELKRAIEERFPNHFSGGQAEDPEQKRQREFLFAAMQGYMPRPHCFDELDAYADEAGDKLFLLTAPAGMGKSMLLANWIAKRQEKNEDTVFYRFTGAGLTNVDDLLQSLVSQIVKEKDIPEPSGANVRERFGRLLGELNGEKTIIVLDGLNQLDSGLADLNWLPLSLPQGVKLVASIKNGEADADSYIRALIAQGAGYMQLRPFETQGEREALAQTYLSQYLKGLDGKHLHALSQMEGTNNPLFLKIILSELRTFGSFRTLMEQIKSGYGSTPTSAFRRMLGRLEHDPAYSPIPPKESVPAVFSMLACARQGLSLKQMVSALQLAYPAYTEEQCRQAVNLLMRQMRPFMVRKQSSMDFLYESLKDAARERYGEEAVQTHALLVRMFCALADPAGNGSFAGELQPVAQLPYHLYHANKIDELIELMTDLRYLDVRCGFHDIYPLLADFAYPPVVGNEQAMELCAFIKRHAQRLLAYENLFFSLLRHENVANGLSEQLLAGGTYRKPWIQTEHIPIDISYLEQGDSDAGGISITASYTYSMANIGALSGDGKRAFFMEKLGVLRIVDTDTMNLQNRTVTITPGRALTMACNGDGSKIAVAYESGTLECYAVHFEGGELHYAEKTAGEPYYLPEFEDPVLLYGEDSLYFQKDEGILVCESPAGKKESSIESGEVSGLVCMENGMLALLRQGNDTLVTLPASGVSKRYPGCDVLAAVSLPGGRAAVSFSDGTLVVLDDGLEESARTKPEQPAKVLANRSELLTGFSDNMHKQFLWNIGTGELHQTDAMGMFANKGLRIRPLGLHDAGEDSICLTDSGAFRYGETMQPGKRYTIDFAAALTDGDTAYSLRESKDRHWIARASEENGYLYNTDNNLILRAAWNAKDDLLLANPVGGGMVAHLPDRSIYHAESVPAGLAGMAGGPDGGFFLAQRNGDVLSLQESGAVTKAYDAQQSGIHAASVSIRCMGNLLVWRGILQDEAPGITAERPATLLRFFRVKGGSLVEMGRRAYGKREGEVRAMAVHGDTFYLPLYVDGVGTVLHFGSVQDFIGGSERQSEVDIMTVLDAAYMDALLLLGNRAIYAVDADSGKTLATLEAELPFTALCANSFHARPPVLIQGERELYRFSLRR